MARRPRKRGAGSVRQLPSGRWQARYRDAAGTLRTSGITFDTRLDASAWLDAYLDGEVTPGEKPRPPILRDYATTWLDARTLKPRTRSDYRSLLDDRIVPTFGDLRLDRITPTAVRSWHAGMSATPTLAARAYGLLRTILRTAVDDDLVESNPCRVRGGGSAPRATTTTVLSIAEVDALVEAMPDRYKAAVVLATWCGLRFGELTELRRADVAKDASTVTVRRAVTRVDGEFIVGTPKSDAGVRTVSVPPHVRPVLVAHLKSHVGRAPGSLVLPAAHGDGHLSASTLYKVFYPARDKIKRPDLRWHDLRHTGAVLATLAGASLVEVQGRLGHSTVVAAMRYQHVAAGRDDAIGDALSGLAGATVTPIKRSKRRTGAAG